MTSAQAPTRLRCEHRVDPLGIDVADPRLSWEPPISPSRARVRVASSPAALAAGDADVWDSGWIETADPEVVYAGPPVSPSTRVHWTVAVEDGDGNRSAEADAAWWETAIAPDAWTAAWIAAPFFAIPHLRSEIELGAAPVSARLSVTALGLYRASINGERVGDALLRPGWTDYRYRAQVDTYDVTDLLQPGPNALGLVLAEGWYAGRIGWFGERAHYGRAPQVLAQLDVELADGSSATFGTGRDGWSARAGAIVQSEFLTGERHDQRMALEGWDRPGYAPPHRPGKAVEVVAAPEGVALVAPLAEPVRITEEVAVQAVTEPAPGTFVLDLGQNLVGWARIRVTAPRGHEVRLRFAEMLTPDGHLYTDNLRMAQACDTYTCAGTGEETWEPAFTFHGFRYVEVTGWPGGGAPPDGAVVGVVVHNELERTGVVETSNPLVEQLLSNIDWGLRGNFVEVPTDCPQRDERLGWMGDIQVFAATACFNRDVQSFLTKWMWDVVDGQTDEGAFPDVAPKVVDLQNGMPAWGDAGVIVPWRLYEWYGDERVVRTHHRAAAKWVDFVASANPDGIWANRRSGDVGDWLSVGANTPKDVLATAFFAQSAELASRMAAIAGESGEAVRLRKISERARTAFLERFVDADGRIEGDTQTCYALALRFGLLPEELRPVAGERLAADVTERDFHPTVGFVGVPHLLPALSDTGHSDVAYKVLLQTTFPSWGHQIECGATTMWERWDGWTPEQGFQTPEMNSFNHYAFGAVGEWIATRVAGIGPHPDHPGFRVAWLRPTPGDGLDWAKGRFRSVRGTFECGWQRLDDGHVRYDVAVPPTASALLELPGVDTAIELAPGRHTFTG